MEKLRIGVCFGKFDTTTDGLGEFCSQIGTRLASRAEKLRKEHGIELFYHLKPEKHGHFGHSVNYLPLRPIHKLFHGSFSFFDVWHTLHQHVKHIPPWRTTHRLLTVHDLNYLYGPEDAAAIRVQKRVQKSIGRADSLVAITRHVATDIKSHLGWQEPIRVVHNGARSLVTHPRDPVAGLSGRPFFFHLSRMAPSKNVESILGLAGKMKDHLFVLAGPRSNDSARISDLVSRLGLDNVRIFENITDAQKSWLYANAQGFLFPSLTEGFGLPPIEAMHFGCPVFLSDRTCLPEVGGDAAAYWTDFTPDRMLEVVEREFPRLSSPVGRENSRLHASRFDWERCVDQYIEIYLDLIRAKTPAGNENNREPRVTMERPLKVS